MRIPRSASALSAAVLTAAVLAPAPAHAAVTRIENTVQIRCAFTTQNQSSDWYFPAGTPKALVWLQHGFVRANDHVADLATEYAEHGYLVFAPSLPSASIFGCTLQNIGNNTDYLDNVADLFGKAADPADKLGRSFSDAKARAGRSGLALPSAMVFAGHSAGGEAVPYVANRLRTAYPQAFARLRGLVLFDPVKSFVGDNLGGALDGLKTTSLPIQAVSAPHGTCNNSGSGTSALQDRLDRPFLGVRLTTGAHTDAEGASTDGVGTLACGTPKAPNIAILQTLATNWSDGYLTGSPDPAYYPGGAYYDGLADIETLS
ncbi:hypothetical protein OHA77_03290 [Streptosporangium sp. NBC_01639]|uniref:hypothetical protein n=1 Tax=Streptosporangium sp. NBC_01639 TaxID=2975948 RepID=UPI00386DAE7A|nr:hypothetical protein OHA77_03290 [Streptosporangium sp. NBC_01639]